MTTEIDDIRRQNEEILNLLKAQKEAKEKFVVSPNVISAEGWTNESSLTERGRIGRRDTLNRLVRTNGKTTFAELFADIVSKKSTIYSVSKKFVDTMREDGLKPAVVYVHRSRLPDLFISVLGDENFNRKLFDRLVPKGPHYVTIRKAIPTWEQTKHMLSITTPGYRALIAWLAVTGCRIDEALSRKMSDLERKPQGYAVVKLYAGENKGQEFRCIFLTKEVVDMVNIYHLSVKSDWIFPGEDGNHLSYAQAADTVKQTFIKAGLVDIWKVVKGKDGKETKFAEAYSAHSFRTTADSRMSKAGLDRKYILLTISHKGPLAASGSYQDWVAIEKEWFEKCESTRMLSLSEVIEVIKVDPQVERIKEQNKAIISFLGHLLTPEQRKKLGIKLPIYSEEQIDKLLEDGPDNLLENKSEKSEKP